MPNGAPAQGLPGSGSAADPHMTIPAPLRSSACMIVPVSPGTTSFGAKPKAFSSQSMAAGASAYLMQGNTVGWVAMGGSSVWRDGLTQA